MGSAYRVCYTLNLFIAAFHHQNVLRRVKIDMVCALIVFNYLLYETFPTALLINKNLPE